MLIILLRTAIALGSVAALAQTQPDRTPQPPAPGTDFAVPAALTPIRCFAPLATPQLWNSARRSDASRAFYAQIPAGFAIPQDPVAKQLVREYGATLVARGAVVRPITMIFPNESAVSAWQLTVPAKTATVGGVSITLQSAALDALQAAIVEAKRSKIVITPTGADAARRDYARTIVNWKSRVDGGLTHWRTAKKLSAADAESIVKLSPAAQIPRILALEEQGLCFATLRNKTILRSVAAPGSSQHIFMLALDVKQHGDPRVRAVMARHGWFQTVVTDEPHFTYLGTDIANLPKLGLKPVTAAGRTYWVPDID